VEKRREDGRLNVSENRTRHSRVEGALDVVGGLLNVRLLGVGLEGGSGLRSEMVRQRAEGDGGGGSWGRKGISRVFTLSVRDCRP